MRIALIIWIFFSCSVGFSRKPVPASRFEQLTGRKLTDDSKLVWDHIYNRSKFVYGKTPSKFLSQNYPYMPSGSKVLDIGMGEGRNAVFLAQKGYQVTGIDISSVAVKKAQLLAKEFGVKVKSLTASIYEYEFPEKTFDVIICFYFVDRSLITKFEKWLKPNGIIVYEAYTLKQRAEDGDKAGEKSDYLKEGELLKMFSNYKVLKYENPAHLGEHRASIIVQKR